MQFQVVNLTFLHGIHINFIRDGIHPGLGGIGGTAFTPIVNAPEVAILGVSKSEMKPKWNGKEFEPKLMVPLSMSYDHRVIDGALAARFTVTLASYMSDIRQLVM